MLLLLLALGGVARWPGPHSLFGAAAEPFFWEWQRAAFRLSWLVPLVLAALLFLLWQRGDRLPALQQAALLFGLGWLYLASWPAVSGPWREELLRPFAHPQHYWQDAALLESVEGELVYPTSDGPLPFFAGYPALQHSSSLRMHARTHPPFAVGFFYGCKRVGLGRLGSALLLPGALALAALIVFLYVRARASPSEGRLAALALLLSPQLGLYGATSLDAWVACLTAGAVIGFLFWLERGSAWGLLLFALALGVAVHTSYLVLTVGTLLAGVALFRYLGGDREALARGILAAYAAGLGALLLAWGAGFDFVEAFREAYRNQALFEVAWRRVEFPFFWRVAGGVGYLAVLGLPLSALALLSLRGAWSWERLREQALLVSALLAVVVSLALGFVLGEGERLFLFYTPLVVAGLSRPLQALVVNQPRLAAACFWILVLQTFVFEILFNTQW